jgi:ABC-type multidrug transport system ATPase subunit
MIAKQDCQMATSPDLNFISLAKGETIPTDLRDTFVIRSDNWDDYNSKLRFDLLWINKEGERIVFGKTKILGGYEGKVGWTVKGITSPPVQFSVDIGLDFISLGQSEAYYSQLYETFGENAKMVLTALRDIAIAARLADRFETSTVFRNGMMRENTAWRALQFGSAWSQGDEPPEKPSFHYECRISDNEEPFKIEFDFSVSDILPGRVVGIIGRNAVGKTRFLAQLSTDLTQARRVSAATVEERKSRFPVNQPLFTRILAVSYSAFDRFRRPETHPESSYIYCGIRDEKGNISQTWLQRTFRLNKKRVRELSRDDDWIKYISKIMGDTSEITNMDLQSEIESDDEESKVLLRLSSGQAILCHLVTGLLAWLKPESLVLFDEPETHLHPNAVANLFVVLTDILRRHKSYAVVATHSPLVIQEIPSKRVLVFTREKGVTDATVLQFESFGESLAELTDHVFKTREAESLYRNILNNLAEAMTLEEALGMFTNRLSMNAKSYLLARYNRATKQ